jgi:type IV pilus assembly protein PilW
MSSQTNQTGFSLVELMVAMTLSLVLLGGVIAMFVSSRKTYETTDQLSRLQETGRFALDMIVHDLRSAGYGGCNRRTPFTSSLRAPNSLLWNFSRPIEGFEGQGAGWAPPLDAVAIINANSAGDAIAIRYPRDDFQPLRVTSSMTLATSPVQVDATALAAVDLDPGDVIEINDCLSRTVIQVTDTTGGALAHIQSNATGTTPGNLTDSAGAAILIDGEVLPLTSVVYFLRNSGSGSGLALWRRVASAAQAEELAEGVESMQFQYGQDTDNDAVISVDEYRSANLVTDWNQVLSVRVALLVRSLSEFGTDRDVVNHAVLDRTVAAPNDRRLRQVFSTTVTVRNSAI